MGIWSKFLRLFRNKTPKIGDIVVCIDDIGWNTPQTDIKLILNKKYKILGTINQCHFDGYDIGARLTPSNLFTICECGKAVKGMGIHWVYKKRFRKATVPEVIEWLREEIKVAIKEEDYSEAAKLQKKIEKLEKE